MSAQGKNQGTRAALVRSAERLIAERGLGAVSVKDITREAGARNPSAVHYHFGNLEELIKEVFAETFNAIEADRLQRFAELDAQSPEEPLYAYLEAAVTPWLETCLSEEGREYVGFSNQFVADPRFDLGELVDEASMTSLKILGTKLAECLPELPGGIFMARLRQGFRISIIQAADYCALLEAGVAPPHEKIVRESARSLSGFFSASHK